MAKFQVYVFQETPILAESHSLNKACKAVIDQLLASSCSSLITTPPCPVGLMKYFKMFFVYLWCNHSCLENLQISICSPSTCSENPRQCTGRLHSLTPPPNDHWCTEIRQWTPPQISIYLQSAPHHSSGLLTRCTHHTSLLFVNDCFGQISSSIVQRTPCKNLSFSTIFFRMIDVYLI